MSVISSNTRAMLSSSCCSNPLRRLAAPISARRPLSISPDCHLNAPSSLNTNITTNKKVEAPPSRWIADLRSRIGKCIIFGCNTQQISRAAAVLRALALEWKDLLAGSEGYLTDGRRGLDARQIAWGEMDSFGHVNNVNYYRYAESARVNWITNFAVHADPKHREQWAELMTPKSIGLIMKSLKADFKFPMVYPDKISVYHKLRAQPTREAEAPSNFMLDCVVLSHQHRRVSAKLYEDIVVYDYKAAQKTSMPDFMFELFNETWKLQQAEEIRARTRIWELMDAVERLEKETWDREDAVEDMGSAPKGSAAKGSA